MRLADTSFAIVDTETSGTDVATAELYEVAAVRCDARLAITDEFCSFVRNMRPVPHEVSGIHGITDEHLADAPTRREVDFALALTLDTPRRESIMVAHNAEFDRAILAQTLPSMNARSWLCTERLARHLDDDAPNFKLGTLRFRYGHRVVDTRGHGAHRAIADVLVLRQVLGTLLEAYLLRDDARPEEEDFSQRLVAFAQSPVRIKTWPLGKLKGMEIASCMDLDYMAWVIGPRGITDLRADLRWTIEQRMIEMVDECVDRGQLRTWGDLRNPLPEALLERMRDRYRAIGAAA